MNPITAFWIVMACIAGGSLLGFVLRSVLPEHHLDKDAKDVVRLGTGLIASIAALVLGLLIASANTSFETKSAQVKQMTAQFILLDATLEQYGPEANAARNILRRGVPMLVDRIWREDSPENAVPTSFRESAQGEIFIGILFNLSPQNDTQKALKARALDTTSEIARTRLLLFVEGDNSIPVPFLIVLVLWLTIIFASFSLFAKPSPVVLASLLVFGLSAASAVLLILDLGQPFAGLMKISSAPLREALAPLVP
jgi:hypothetical protein